MMTFGGRERILAEWRDLAAGVGLEVQEIHQYQEAMTRGVGLDSLRLSFGLNNYFLLLLSS